MVHGTAPRPDDTDERTWRSAEDHEWTSLAAIAKHRVDSWAAALLALLSSAAIGTLLWIAYENPAPVNWPTRESPAFALEPGTSGSWSPQFDVRRAKYSCRGLVRVPVSSTVSSNDFRVLVRVDPPEAACPTRFRIMEADGYFPAGDGSDFHEYVQVDLLRVQRIDYRVELRRGREPTTTGGTARLEIRGHSDSEFDMETPALIGASLLGLLVLLPSVVWFRRERRAVRSTIES